MNYPSEIRPTLLAQRLLICFLVITGAVALVGVSCVLLDEQHHNVWAAIGELLLVVVFVVGEIVAIIGLFQLSTDSRFHCWVKAQEIWTRTKFTRQRTAILTCYRDPKLKYQLGTVLKDDALDVCRRMDEVAYLAEFLGEERIFKTWDDPLAKAWVVLKKDTLDVEREKTEWKVKWEAFYVLGKKAAEKLKKEGRMTDDKLKAFDVEL